MKTPRDDFWDLVRALRERGYGILATQLWLARRYPENGALRSVIARSIERLAKP